MSLKNPRLNGYQSHLQYEKILKKFKEEDCTIKQMQEHLECREDYLTHVFKILKKENVIKVTKFNLHPSGTKEKVYGLIKNGQ